MSELNIYQRILKVMEEVTYIRKESRMVNNQYTFVSHDAVSAALHPVLVKHGIAVIPRVTNWAQDGNRTTVDIEVDYVNADKPDDRVTVPTFGFGIDPQDKGPGKAISYATKMNMLKTFVLETGDDPERDLVDHKSELAMLIEKHQDSIVAIKQGIAENDYPMAAEAWYELDTPTKAMLFTATSKGGPLSPEERRIMRTQEFQQHRPEGSGDTL